MSNPDGAPTPEWGADSREHSGPGPDAGHGRRAALCLLMTAGRDRQLLADWLAGQPQYTVSTAAPGDPVPEDYDLCLVDRAGLDRSGDAIRDRREAADPLFLPHLLLTGEDPDLSPTAARLVDDVVGMPAEKDNLRRRIDNLLRTRWASLRLAEREEQYEQLVQLTPEPLLLVRDAEVLYANEAAAETFGMPTPEEFRGEPIARFVPEEAAADLVALLETVRQDGRLGAFRDLPMVSEAGDRIEAAVAGVTVTYEGAPAVQLLVRDLTEQRRREQQLTLFGRAIETAAQGITIADARQEDEPLIYANEAFERISGYSSAECLGRNCRFLQGEATDEGTVAEVAAAIDDREPVTVELLNYRKDGTPFWNRLEIVPVRDGEGTVTHFLGLQRDVTERKEREERLAVLDRVLRHNIRNRMNVIRSRAELLGGEGGDSDAVAAIIDAADDLVRISEQVRKFQSIISTDERTLQRYDLSDLLTETVEGVLASHPEAEIQLDCPGAATARLHPTASAALQELFELAVESAGADGARLTVRVGADDDSVWVDIHDRAGSIPEADLAAITRGTETSLHHAFGLELWLIRWAVLYSEGDLSVSEVDGTTRLRMRFPAA